MTSATTVPKRLERAWENLAKRDEAYQSLHGQRPDYVYEAGSPTANPILVNGKSCSGKRPEGRRT